MFDVFREEISLDEAHHFRVRQWRRCCKWARGILGEGMPGMEKWVLRRRNGVPRTPQVKLSGVQCPGQSSIDGEVQITLLSGYSTIPTAPLRVSSGMSSRTTSSEMMLSMENHFLPFRAGVS